MRRTIEGWFSGTKKHGNLLRIAGSEKVLDAHEISEGNSNPFRHPSSRLAPAVCRRLKEINEKQISKLSENNQEFLADLFPTPSQES